MHTRESTLLDDGLKVLTPHPPHLARASGLHLVTPHEVRDLEQALSRGQIPPDLESKLRRLNQGNLLERMLEQNCQLLISLLSAAQQGLFKAASPVECERLLQALAYVRKDDDAIPDYQPDGFKDDLQELRAVTTELAPVLQEFKAWRLRHQVPGLWARDERQFCNPRPAAVLNRLG